METVATNIVQTVSFYNTSGVIEREHNLYFCPKYAGMSTNVSASWLADFESKVFRRYNYPDTVSQWSPEDRVLTVKGRIEDFRANASGSFKRPLNYMILTQTITKNYDEVIRTGYFVKSARQNGIGAVTLELEPDHFTNVFYLQYYENTSSSTDLFNTFLKNCYVERQHYNRTTYSAVRTRHIEKVALARTDELGNVTFTFKVFKYELGENYDTIFYELKKAVDSEDNEYTEATTPIVNETSSNNYIEVTYETYFTGISDEIVLKGIFDVKVNYIFHNFVNEKVFMNYEENFRYKRQLKDKKIRITNALTSTEITSVKNNAPWDSLTSSLKEKIIKQSLACVHFTLKNSKIIVRDKDNNSSRKNRLAYPNSNIRRQMPDVFQIFMLIPDMFMSYKYDIKKYFDNIYIRSIGNELSSYNVSSTWAMLSSGTTWAEYIASSYISKDDEVLKHISIETVNNNNAIIINDVRLNNSTDIDGISLCILPTQEDIQDTLDNTITYGYSVDNNNNFTPYLLKNGSSLSHAFFTYLISNNNEDTITLNLSDNETPSKTSYFEPILTFSPYSFYTISYLGNIEVPLNKNAYYEVPVIDLHYIISVTDTMKVSIIPEYCINTNWYKYFNDSLVITLNNELTFSSTMLDEYLIQNKAQMKNQYAINEENLWKNMGTSALSGLGTGLSAGMMTGNAFIGLGAGLVGAGVGAISSVITYSVNEKQIQNQQNAIMSDLGNRPNVLKQTGTDIVTDTAIGEMGLYLNHYTIDTVSYNNIAKYLERYGYIVNKYDSLHTFDRKGWNYIKLADFELDVYLTQEQEESIRQIFKNGVTLLHEPSYLHSNTLHNYETILD